VASTAVKFNLKGVVEDMDRHGNVYFRPPGKKKVRLRERPGSVEFHEAVAAIPNRPPATVTNRCGRKRRAARCRWWPAVRHGPFNKCRLPPKENVRWPLTL
jgi:hypothetical protein